MKSYSALTLSGCDPTFRTTRLIQTNQIRLSEIISALSVSLDITQGHPQGHSMRTALIGMRIAQEVQLSASDQSSLFYALLLKDLGCSSNAAKISNLFGADDHAVKLATRLSDWRNPWECLKNGWQHAAAGGNFFARVKKLSELAQVPKSEQRNLTQTRCDRGALIARKLLLPEPSAIAISHLDEHWDGGGMPVGLKGDEISLLGRICGLAQTVEVFMSAYDLKTALSVAKKRSGKWFDPELVQALLTLKKDTPFWNQVRSGNSIEALADYEPSDKILLADAKCLDRVCEAFAMVVDAKSPWTFKHSSRVADIAAGVGTELGCTPEVVQDIRRAALLHDIGKLGVSNMILDKAGRPTDSEFAAIRKHAEYTFLVLKKVDAFSRLAGISAAHHERLDGQGYHLGVSAIDIHPISRILAVADTCDAMSSKRPYRDPMSWDKVHSIMTKDVGTAIDGECFEALVRWYQRNKGLESRVDIQLANVEALLSEQ